jgi:RNA methyltransferase, TrmH family
MSARGPRSAPRSDTRKLLRIAGLPAVAALFATTPERVERLLFDARLKPEVSPFCAELARQRKPYREVEVEDLARLAGPVLHGGILALAQPRPVPAFDPAQAATWARRERLLLMLDGIGNPHNLGAIVRTAAFFGVPRIVISDHPEQAGPSDASYRVAEGGMEYVGLYRARHFAQALRSLRCSHCVIGAAAENGKPIDAIGVADRPVALVLGNEQHGLPRDTRRACDELVTLPGSGSVQSLNVAATAAILIYAFSNKNPSAPDPKA